METTCDKFLNCERRLLKPCTDCPQRSPQSTPIRLLNWRSISDEQRELVLMVIAGVALAVGWLADWRGYNQIASISFLITYLSGGWYGTINGINSLKCREIDVDLLMILAALGAALVGAPFEGGMLLFLFALSNVLQNHALNRSRKAIRSLMKLRPSTVLCEVDGTTRNFAVEAVTPGMIIRLRPGDRIALDGEVVGGETTIDESSLTGESMPVSKSNGDTVFAGTINQHGSLSYKVTKIAADSTLAKIIALVEEAQEEKARTERFLDQAERYYATAVVALTAALIIVPPLLLGSDLRESFYRAMTILVVASPCALIISTPAAFLSAIAGAAKRGVLFKGGLHLERLASVDTLAIDKTGTLTMGMPEVTDIVPCPTGAATESDQIRRGVDLLQLAASLETYSEHPIARALERKCSEKRCGILAVSDFQALPGKGAQAMVAGKHILLGSPALMVERGAKMDDSSTAGIDNLLESGKTVVVLAETDSSGSIRRILGWIAVADKIRENAKEVIQGLKRLGIRRIVMLTGDNEKVAREVARQIGIDEVHAQLLPDAKLECIRQLASEGTVAMVGDGINDAPALAKAHVGIAMGAAGTDVAMETADVVLMSSKLPHLLNAFALAKKSRTVVTQNLTFAISVIVVLVVSALFNNLPLPLGVVGHEGSTVLVCLNGLRLLAFKHRDGISSR